MKAFTQERYGSADVLRIAEVERPVPGGRTGPRQGPRGGRQRPRLAPDARGADLVRPMLGWRRPKQAERGVDVAGTVEAVGPGVDRFAVGDDVVGWCFGAFADYAVAAKAEASVRKPEGITFEQAAAIPTSAMTAWRGLARSGRVQAGQRVLVVGATGGVGSYAVQIAKALGAQVTGVCSTPNVDLVSSATGPTTSSTTPDRIRSVGRLAMT